VHYGMTSSDLGDTALCFQMTQAFDILIADVRRLGAICKRRSLETRDDARPVGEEADPAWIATEHVLADAPGRVLAALREGLPVLAGSEAPVGV